MPDKHYNHSDISDYTCPMHPEIQQDKPGMCPECGMYLVPGGKLKAPPVGRAGKSENENNQYSGHSTQMFLRKFWISLILTIPVLLYSDLAEKILGLRMPEFSGSEYLPVLLSSIIFFYGGWIFTKGAWLEVRGRQPGMMTLIGLAIWTAYLYSIFQTFSGGDKTLYWELTTLITVMLLGHWIEMKAVQGAQGALRELSKLLPDEAEVIRGEKIEKIPLTELQEGNIIIIRPGSKVAADGKVIDGKSEVNEAMVTGESKPSSKFIGSEVIAGTINGDGSLRVRVNKIGEHTFLAGVMRLVEEAQRSKSRLQILSDRAAFYLTLIAIFSGGITFVAWFFSKSPVGGGFSFAMERLVAVLVIVCPHALGLAVPLVASISTTLAARNGFLVRQRLALESARKIDIVMFDKTGTLTKGEYGVDEIIPNPNLAMSRSGILQLAASVNRDSEHFAAKAIVKEAENRGMKFMPLKNFQRVSGKGVYGLLGNNPVWIGGEAVLTESKDDVSGEFKSEIEALASEGKTINFVVVGGRLVGAIALADLIREESREAILKLKQMGIKVGMITGDSMEVASWVAKELNIDEYFSKVLPKEKSEKVKFLQEKKGMKVAMVGDGINDAPALAQADLGIAIGAGTNVAIESAGIILVRNDPRDIAKIIKLSRLTYRKMIQNLFWAAGYNLAALPLAAGALAFKGILLNPAVSALFMSLSTVIVAVNAILLKKHKLV